MKMTYLRLATMYEGCISECIEEAKVCGWNVNLAVKRNEILLIDVRHLPRHRLLPPSETVYNEPPVA